MNDGIDELRRGADALCDWDGPLRERLLFAAQRFWSGYFFHHEWPDELVRRSDAIVRTLFERGTIRHTLATMPDADVPNVASQLLEFIESAELSLDRAANDCLYRRGSLSKRDCFWIFNEPSEAWPFPQSVVCRQTHWSDRHC